MTWGLKAGTILCLLYYALHIMITLRFDML